MSPAPKFSIVAPVFNEAASLPEFIQRVAAAMQDRDWDLFLVDDGLQQP